ncbi:MAG TPA: glycosyltransferase [Methylomirabilota bacterium]|nr:glycosyltransferase [Methylomirabilota bacterium]
MVIPTFEDEERLALTLSALVPAAAEGVVREVVVADAGSGDQTRRVADAMGCVIVEASGPAGAMLSRGAAAVTRGDFILFLRPGVILDPRWDAEASSFMERAARAGQADRRAAVFRYECDDIGPAAQLRRVAVATAGRLSGLPHPMQPLLISRRHYERIGGHRPLDALEDVDLVRRIGRGRIVRLRSAGVVLPKDRPFEPTGLVPRLRRGLSRGLAALPVPATLLARLHG